MNRTKTLGWLVGAAALLFAGCSSENDLAEEPKTIEPQATTIRVTVGAGISDDDGATRSTVTKDGSTRTLKFTTGDKLYVWGGYGDARYEPSGAIYYDYIVAGFLDLDTKSFEASDPTNATFTGELTVYQWINEQGHTEQYDEYVEEQGEWRETYDDDGNLISSDWVITVEAHTETKEIWVVDTDGYYKPTSSSGIFSTADPLGECSDVTGTLIHEGAVEGVDYTIFGSDRHVSYSVSCAATVEALMTKELEVKGDYNAGSKSFSLAVETRQAILNFTFSGLTAGATYQVDYRYGYMAAMEYTRSLVSSSSPLTATGGTLSFACFAIVGDNFYHGIRLTNTADAGDVAELSLGKMSFTNKVYNVKRNWTGTAFIAPQTINLSSVTTTDGKGQSYVTARNGDVLTGYFQNEGYVTIADGATVTLSDVNIQAPYECDHAAIHCLGSANIILSGSGENDVNAGDGSDYPAVYVPSGKTLTISGTGSLTAYSNSNGAACIGGGNGIDCGSVVIAGGTVIATGGSGAAGIGSGQNGICGDITITGGNVMAMGGDSGVGIGSGQSGSCGDISITAGTVEATGCESAAGIGSGNNGLCGDITIGSGITRVDAKKGYNSEYIIGGYNHGMVKIDGVEMSSDQLRNGLYSYPSNDKHVFPNLSSNCDGTVWTLYKE